MKIFYSLYELKPLSNLSSAAPLANRNGALLRVQWADRKFGYADIHPWPEFGDRVVKEHIEEIRSGHITQLMEQSIWMARRDAILRFKKSNLFSGILPVKNNFVIPDATQVSVELLDQISKEGFGKIKIKVGRDLPAELQLIQIAIAKGFLLRLDFNASANWQLFEAFISKLSASEIGRIEYIEEPFPYDEDSWREAQKLVKIAIDFEYPKVNWLNIIKPPFDVLIIKPARMDVDTAVSQCQKFQLHATVTSSMDHPIGCVHALAVAADLKMKYPSMILDAGCMTHQLFQMDAFSADIQSRGPYFTDVPGTGIGFDSHLEKLTWLPIRER